MCRCVSGLTVGGGWRRVQAASRQPGARFTLSTNADWLDDDYDLWRVDG